MKVLREPAACPDPLWAPKLWIHFAGGPQQARSKRGYYDDRHWLGLGPDRLDWRPGAYLGISAAKLSMLSARLGPAPPAGFRRRSWMGGTLPELNWSWMG